MGRIHNTWGKSSKPKLSASQPSVCPSGLGRPRAKARPTKKLCRIVRSKCHTVNIFSSARVLARYGSQTAKQCFCAKGHSPGWAGMDLSRGIKPRPAMKPPKRVRTADQLFRICTHRRDRYRDPAFEVKLCAACRTQQVVYKSSRSKRQGARCIGDRVGVLPNGSMHPDVPASTCGW